MKHNNTPSVTYSSTNVIKKSPLKDQLTGGGKKTAQSVPGK